jgi:hypothetical protein
MPIYDQSYRPYRGTLSPHTWRWATIARAGIAHYLSRKMFLVFLFTGFIPAIARGVIIWFAHQTTATAQMAVIDGAWFRNFLEWQGQFLLLVCIWPGAVLIARDLKTNAIQLYLSKPLTKLDYVVGKFAILAGIAALLMPAPALMLFLMEVGLSTDTVFISNYFWLPFAIVGYSLVVILGAGLLSLAASSFTRSGRYAGLLFFAIVFFSQAGAGLLRLVTGDHSWTVLSLPALVDQVGALFFGGPTEYGVHPLPALVMYLLVVGLSALVLRRRVQAVEIVT